MICKICLFDNKINDVQFDDKGVCNYCIRHQLLEKEYPNDAIHGKEKLETLLREIRDKGRNKKYDCVVGVSGGCDSSYLLDLVSKYNLHPLAVHFDNGWDTEIAKHNMTSVCSQLGIDLILRTVDSREFDDIARSFMLAGVVDIDAASDIGMITVMYQEAEKNDISYILEGHSFRTEGIQPISWAYVDGKYISEIHKTFGRRAMVTFPNLWYDDFVHWVKSCGIQRIRPLYYVPYIKSSAQKYLKEEYNWKSYTYHHAENEFSAFNYTYFLPRRINVDERINEYSALIRSGQMSRDEASQLLKYPLQYSEQIVSKVKKRLEFSEQQFEQLMNQPLKTVADFESYKSRFEADEPFWRKMYQCGRVPKSFYLKYCSPAFM